MVQKELYRQKCRHAITPAAQENEVAEDETNRRRARQNDLIGRMCQLAAESPQHKHLPEMDKKIGLEGSSPFSTPF